MTQQCQPTIVERLLERHRVDSERMWPPPSSLDLDAAACIEELEAAVLSSMTAIDDWLHVYAFDLCEPSRVEEAQKRIGEHGTLSYIATVQQINRAALQPKD